MFNGLVLAAVLRGAFPLLCTPCTEKGELDTETLARETRFVADCGVDGVICPAAGGAAAEELQGLVCDRSLELAATGFFRVEQGDDGVWRFVTPGGHGFYLAANNGPSSMSGDSCPALGYSPWGRKIREKYGKDKARWAADTRERLLSWGFNAISTWGMPVGGIVGGGIGHLCVVQMGREYASSTEPNCESNLMNNVDVDGHFPNVFRPDFETFCQALARKSCAAEKDNPWIIGWYTDNEISWRGALKNDAKGLALDGHRGTGMYDAVVKLPPEHSGRQALDRFLAGRGLSPTGDVPVQAKQDFLRLVAREYYRITTSAIRAADPNHLVLGCRFAGLRATPDIAWTEGGRWNDVMSANVYPPVDLTNGVILTGSYDARPLAERMRELSKMAGRPVIVTEWSFRGMDTECPNTHGAGAKVPTQTERAAAGRLMVESMLKEPTVLGTAHFRWVDMPPLGRWTLTGGEDSNYGLVNNDDEPYELMTQMFADVHTNLYAIRAQAEKLPRLRVDETRETVWRDCVAWYMGGSDKEGPFVAGDLTDIRHAAVADAPTHGGTARGNAAGITNLRETVYSAACGRTFENQRTVFLSQRDGLVYDKDKGTDVYKVYENGVTLPFAATNANYTLLFRVRLAETQPHSKEWVYVADMGYGGGSAASSRYSFSLRYNPTTEQIGVLYNNASKSKSLAPTNDVCTTLRGKWLEVSVSLEMLAGGESRMRFGVAAEGIPRTYSSADFAFPSGQNLPKSGKLYLAGVTGYGGASALCSPARGSYQMVAYWERVLADDEILAAFKIDSLAAGCRDSAAVLRIGGTTGADTLGGRIAGESATAVADLQDIGAFPAVFASGQTLHVPFEVFDTSTNLNQVVRLAGAAESNSAFSVAVDGMALANTRLQNGTADGVGVPGELLTAGAHLLSIRRVDAGASEAWLTRIEISGSFRIGWEDKKRDELGGDITSAAGTKSYAVTQLSSNGWKTVRSSVSASRIAEVLAEVSAEDAARRGFVFRTRPCSYPAQKYHLVITANDREVYRREISPDEPYASHRADPIAVRFRPGDLKAGVNVFSFRTEVATDLDKNPSSTWLHLDYFALEANPDKMGFGFILR